MPLEGLKVRPVGDSRAAHTRSVSGSVGRRSGPPADRDRNVVESNVARARYVPLSERFQSLGAIADHPWDTAL